MASYNELHAPFVLMQETTAGLKAGLGGLATSHTATLIFGSPHRAEMLPQSDIDVIVISDGSKRGDAERDELLNAARKLPYDKIDTPDNIRTIEDLADTYAVGSPETNIADSTFIGGSTKIRHRLDSLGMDAFFSSREHLVPKQAFQHFFFDAWSKRKLSSRGVNIKYSIGGARDLIILDQFHDLDTRGSGKQEARSRGTPQILSYLADRFQGDSLKYEAALFNIGLLIATKHVTMNLDYEHDTDDRGYLNEQTAKRMVDQATELRQYARSPQELMGRFNDARLFVRGLREKEYKAMVSAHLSDDHSLLQLHDRVYFLDSQQGYEEAVNDVIAANEEVIDITLIDRAGRLGTELPRVFSDKVMSRGSWYTIGMLAMHDRLTGELLDRLIADYGQRLGFSFVNRMAIKHPSLTRKVAERLLNSGRLAVDNSVNERYMKDLHDRYERLPL